MKLSEDFFRQKEIKQLRKIAGGDTFTIIYLKMLLRSLKDNGKLYYEGFENNFASEVALDIDEDVENVKVTVSFLIAKGILVQCDTDEYELLTAGTMTGSEGDSARRMRKLRTQKMLASQSDSGVTRCDTEIEKEIEKRDRGREEYISSSFVTFWQAYPRKVAKPLALKSWKSLKPDEGLLNAILADIKRKSVGEWAGKSLTYIPHPSTYLNQRRWEDEDSPLVLPEHTRVYEEPDYENNW